MKRRIKPDSARVDAAVAQSVNFEISLADQARRSERRAWWVAASAIAVALMLGAGYIAILPLKEKVPYLVMADAYTGTATVAQLRGDFLRNDITKQEAVNRSNVAHFVLARESYDAALMKLRDWTTVYTMSAQDVASGYTALNSQRNPDSPAAIYGASKAIRVRILSIVLQGGSKKRASTMATVRFQRSLYDKGAGTSTPLDSKIATLEFTYKDNLAMDEKYRIENPLGFQVTAYRVDNDYAAAPPLEPEMVPPAALAALAAAQPAAPVTASAPTSMPAQQPMPQSAPTPQVGASAAPGTTTALPAAAINGARAP